MPDGTCQSGTTFSVAILLSIAGLGMISGCSTPVSHIGAKREFAIYVGHVDSYSRSPLEYDVDDILLDKSPIITTRDIISYSWKGHEMYLTDDARDRIASLQISTTAGLPFVVCIGDERIYSGAFWVSWSSTSFDGVVVETTLTGAGSNKIRLQLGYPESPERFRGTDPRFDPRVKEVLRRARILK